MCLRKAECQGAATFQDFDHKTMVTHIRKTQQENEAADMWAIKAATTILEPVLEKWTQYTPYYSFNMLWIVIVTEAQQPYMEHGK